MNKLYKNVFVIDDSKADISFIQEAFNDNDLIHKVSPFTDSSSFIKRTRESSYWETIPDLILLDLNMPEISGLTVADTLRGNPRYENVPIVILSGSDNEKDKQEGYSHGANAYLKKPDDYSGWIEMIDNLDKTWLKEEMSN